MTNSPLLEIKNLKKYFPIHRGVFRRHMGDVKAVDGVSFQIEPGEIVGLVGESGSGKSTVGRSAIRLLEPTGGDVFFKGENLCALSAKAMRKARQNIQMVFQDPLASLNPRKTILENVGEALLYHKRVKTREEQVAHVAKILDQVGISPRALDRYPHQFSGGQQQRISIGRAIALNPELVICDEAVSALDLSVQAQILNLLYELKETYNLSYLFISHDLSVVRNFCDRLLVMYRGKIVESGPAEALFAAPQHPYTQMLLSSTPRQHPREKRMPIAPKRSENEEGHTGCPFYNRCPVAQEACKHHLPPTKEKEAHAYTCVH